MAIAGRSYANVPVIIRGSLEDPSDFRPKTAVLVITGQPAAAQTAAPGVTIVRSTLQDPPVLTTAAPVVVAQAPDRRWFNASPVTVIAGPQAPAAVAPAIVVTAQPPPPKTAQAFVTRSTLQDPPALTTPGPVVVASPPPYPKTAQAFAARNTLQDPPVTATRAPLVVSAAADRRWYSGATMAVVRAPAAPAAPAAPKTLLMAGIV